MRVFGVVGFKNSGKTHLVVELVRRLRERGHRVATVKHAHHGFDLDRPGKDSWLHREAGAREVIVASAVRWAHMTELGGAPPPSLPELLVHLGAVDLVLVEGFKREGHPKLQVLREAGDPLLSREDPSIVAVVSDLELPAARVPVLARADVEAIVALVERHAAAPADWAR